MKIILSCLLGLLLTGTHGYAWETVVNDVDQSASGSTPTASSQQGRGGPVSVNQSPSSLTTTPTGTTPAKLVNQKLLNCLCNCIRPRSNFGCSYDLTTRDHSPSCRDLSNGPCLCVAIGCFRGAVPTADNECTQRCRQEHIPSWAKGYGDDIAAFTFCYDPVYAELKEPIPAGPSQSRSSDKEKEALYQLLLNHNYQMVSDPSLLQANPNKPLKAVDLDVRQGDIVMVSFGSLDVKGASHYVVMKDGKSFYQILHTSDGGYLDGPRPLDWLFNERDVRFLKIEGQETGKPYTAIAIFRKN